MEENERSEGEVWLPPFHIKIMLTDIQMYILGSVENITPELLDFVVGKENWERVFEEWAWQLHLGR